MSDLLDIGCLFLIALVIACILSKGYLRYFIVTITIIYYLIGNGVLGTILALPLKSESTDIKACANTKGIILLGAGINNAFDELQPALSAYDRILKTAEVYHQYPQQIIISGGAPFGEKSSEAEIYADLLYKLGIPKSKIILEKNSKNTYQNAEFIKKMLVDDKNTYCLVTGGIHYKRAKIIFDKFAINTISIASSKFVPNIKILPNAYNFYITQNIIHEYLGIVKIYL
ncbi:YdcF family protein [Francisella hispaniensis]|uniref:YdcF family protein n=1 Tax=Francisella hispaniensis TaxID=622488 RepID=UPI001908FD33|nr:YdcF family protein [Francisella hispaniensis]MBK2356730.1 YdcF family protein [Francisella hispaniensis]